MKRQERIFSGLGTMDVTASDVGALAMRAQAEVFDTNVNSELSLCVPVAEHKAKDCRLVGDILSRVGDKWSMLVVMTLLAEPLHFNELKRSIKGVSQQMLSRTLRALERDGMVARTVHVGVPVRVQYALTNIGRSLAIPVQALGSWAIRNRDAIEESRRSYDQNESSSED